MIDSHYGIVNSTAGSTYYVRVLSTLDREKLKANTSIALHRHSHAVVDILPPESDSSIQLMVEKPDVTYHDIGGCDIQKQEVFLSIFVLFSWYCCNYGCCVEIGARGCRTTPNPVRAVQTNRN